MSKLRVSDVDSSPAEDLNNPVQIVLNIIYRLTIYRTMDMNVPILNPQQIEDLNLMIQNILQENTKTIDQVLHEITDVENSSIMKLYNLVVEEIAKKQKIIDNLCHFSLTMMSTVQFLWGQKNDHQDKLSNAEIVIDSLNKHIEQLGEENEIIKHKIQQAETHIESISGQKQKIQELYRSQSCCNFLGNGYFSDLQVSVQKSEVNPRCQTQTQPKVDLLEQYTKNLLEKDNQISVLRDEKRELQQKLSQLLQEHQLVKMEVQLAQIAVKDALSYRESSMISSRSDLNNSYRDQIYTTKSHAQFLNGDLQCFSNLDESFNTDRKPINIKQLASEDNFKDLSQLQNQSFNGNSFVAKKQNEEKAAENSPFKRKQSKIEEVGQKCLTEYNQPEQDISKKKSKFQSSLIKNTKTVSLQCDLIKNAPKIEFLQKQIDKKKQAKTQNLKRIQQNLKKTTAQDKKFKKPEIKNNKNKKNTMTQSLIVGRPSQKEIEQKNVKESSNPEVKQGQQKYSLSKLLNFFTAKIVSQRIKLK